MDFPVEYRDRMLAEQMAMMDAFQFIVQILICFFILVSFMILIVNLSDIVRTRLSERRPSEHRQPPQSRFARRRGSAILFGLNRVRNRNGMPKT